ncbi:DNA alkylation repair protein [Psychrilyobacter atlanticus]|uniref:DNA alkylation repair protein n=1 Tax=Psychrilyobacter atlanticus TaxID=271091 RepID=UPI00041FFECA|nr:DNA alkylation repair protein [Psychrilyobacter atlanticus]
MNIFEELKSLSDESYKSFIIKLVPTNHNILGVRMPLLKKLAKKITKESPYEFLALDKGNNYEMIMLEGLVISSLKIPFSDLVSYIETYMKKIDNWAQVDSFVMNFKGIKKDKEVVFNMLKPWLNSKEEFIVRTALLILLSYYVNKEYLQNIFDISNKITHKGHYVFMGNAWLISVCMAKFPEETILFFKDNRLDKLTHNKAIQKSRESNRVSKEHKNLLKTLKRI